MVQGHGHVGPQGLLDLHRQFRGDQVPAVVEGAPEPYPLLPGPLQEGLPEHLEPAAVGEDAPFPSHEGMDATCLFHDIHPGLEIQDEGIGYQGLDPYLLQFMGGYGLDRCLGGHRHEGRGLYFAVGGGE